MDFVWVFSSISVQFPSAVFSSEEKARSWIMSTGAKGTLTQYPIDISAYDFAVENGYFVPTKPHHQDPEFKSKFTNANNKHFHFNMDEMD